MLYPHEVSLPHKEQPKSSLLTGIIYYTLQNMWELYTVNIVLSHSRFFHHIFCLFFLAYMQQ